jgi:hypothetical protein
VSAAYTATDPATGVELARENLTAFTIGQGESGLGTAVEGAIVGHRANDTLDLAGPVTVTRPQLFDSRESIQTYNATLFAQQVTEPTVGLNFTAYGYNATVTATDPRLVTFRLEPKDGARDPIPRFGLTLVYSSQDGRLLQTLEPTPDTVFTLPSTLPALNLGPGVYKVLPAQDGQLRFARYPGTDPSVAGKAVSFRLAILAMEPGDHHVAASGGAYGVRNSPQLLSDPHTALGLPAAPLAAGQPTR